MSLEEGQFQIDDLKFGTRTVFPVSNWDTGGYDVASSDVQPSRSDNLRFGNDYFVPPVCTWEMACLRNKYLPAMGFVPGARPTLEGGVASVDRMHGIWKSDDIREIYGALKFVTYKRDGVERRFYGRPRQFASGARTSKSEWIPIVANFQRVDTLAYSEDEYTVMAKPGAPASIVRKDGNASTWVNIFIIGPVVNPSVIIGTQVLNLNGVTVGAGKVLNISSYPWERRIVNSDGLNLRAKLLTPYLDQVRLRPGFNSTLQITGTGTNSATAATLAWREAYNTL